MKRLTILLLIICSILLVSGCRKTKENNTKNDSNTTINSPSETIDTYIPTVTQTEDPEIETMLVKNGTTDYKILISENEKEDKYIMIAYHELQYFFNESTGIKLEVVTDSEVNDLGEKSKYLSIGNTLLSNELGLSYTLEELGLDGIKLNTYGNNIIMNGYRTRGAMYAMYEFLERQFNFNNYAADEYVIDHNVVNMNLKEYNVTEVPTFERRSVGLFSYTTDDTFRNRMRQEFYSEGWITWSHSYYKILPMETYYNDHPDWYASDKKQLCLSNKEMEAEFTRVVIEMIKDNPDCNYMSLGQEDTNSFCNCAACQEEARKYKVSGATIRFVNRVAEAAENYLKENEPDREFYFSVFAYQRSQEAPVDENHQALDESVYPRKNVRVLIAPIYACNSHNYYDECNSDIRSLFDDWNVVAKGQIYTWIYNKIFAEYFIPFNNFSTLVQNYEILDSIGTSFVYHQGNKETEAGGMEEVKSYVEAKLMWDRNQNPEELAKDFIYQYYKDAADAYYEYYKLFRITYAIWEKEENIHYYNSGSRSTSFIDTKHFTRDLVDKFNNLFLEMFDSIEKYKTTDYQLYDKLKMRIEKEYLTVRYLYLKFYFDELNYNEAKAMIDDFEKYCSKHQINVWRELAVSTNVDRTINYFVSELRKKLNDK